MTHILIAEDSKTQALQFKGLLEHALYEVTVAHDGVAALESVGKAAPDLVVTDMQMPEMNGLELVRALRFQYPTIPVILMTAHGSDDLAVEALAEGAAGYVPKSKLKEMLLETIEHVLSLTRSDRSFSELIDCMNRNEMEFELPNDPGLIDPLVALLQQMASGMNICDPIDRIRFGSALEEALANAMLRGNMELTREQTEDPSQRDVFASRKSEAPYKDRTTHIFVNMTPRECSVVIRDQGPGFDTSVVPEPKDPHALEREGEGRGLLLMRSFVDELSFNEQGNEVTMIKRRAGPQAVFS